MYEYAQSSKKVNNKSMQHMKPSTSTSLKPFWTNLQPILQSN